ncbi:hypothetical protein RRG08_060432 [Elysia crispata]|uniref:WSC domain-containing protein n=1 Tax=Elysia crispata TaxID=231223 RepID=A0AAE1AL91_9GAST|nr:hypothetical protein RRG08_060432 [Elysia crispata]
MATVDQTKAEDIKQTHVRVALTLTFCFYHLQGLRICQINSSERELSVYSDDLLAKTRCDKSRRNLRNLRKYRAGRRDTCVRGMRSSRKNQRDLKPARYYYVPNIAGKNPKSAKYEIRKVNMSSKKVPTLCLLSTPTASFHRHKFKSTSVPTIVVLAAEVIILCGFCQSGQLEKTGELTTETVNIDGPDIFISRGQRSTDSDSILITYSFIKAAATSPGAAGYMGCFSTGDQWSAETAHLNPALGRDAGHDVRTCIEDCWEQRMRLAMIGRGSSCLCGGLLTMMTKDEPGLCRAPCVKNSTELCGGTTALDVYYTGYIEEPTYDVIEYDEIKTVYQGCYEDPKYQVLCNFSFSTPRLNVQMCMEYCSNNFFKYAVVDSPQRCCCAMTLNEAYRNKPGKCTLLCQDGRGRHEICGGQDGFLSVYVTGAAEFEGWKPKVPKLPWMRPNISESIIRRLAEGS